MSTSSWAAVPRDRPPTVDPRRPDALLPDQPGRRRRARRRDRRHPMAGHLPLAGPQRDGRAASATSTPRSSTTAWSSSPPTTPRRSTPSTPPPAGWPGRPSPIPEEVKLTHLLGVAKGASSPPAIGSSGSTSRPASSPTPGPITRRPARASAAGILAGDKVYWPTKTEIHVLDQATGLSPSRRSSSRRRSSARAGTSPSATAT